jgi:diguanylate cyclase (GGDEF)-like protein
LTRLYNHRYLQQQIVAEEERAGRYKTSLTYLMIDIDDFKSINDTCGHAYGDEVLIVIARIIREQIRRVDTAGRYGGEEFLVLMPHTKAIEAWPVAERIRSEVQEFPFRFEGRNVHVTLSVGMATYDAAIQGFAKKGQLFKAADKALYQAKKDGKNKTQLSASIANNLHSDPPSE